MQSRIRIFQPSYLSFNKLDADEELKADWDNQSLISHTPFLKTYFSPLNTNLTDVTTDLTNGKKDFISDSFPHVTN